MAKVDPDLELQFNNQPNWRRIHFLMHLQSLKISFHQVPDLEIRMQSGNIIAASGTRATIQALKTNENVVSLAFIGK